jgi:predicted O-methyltransferase YrrM
LIASVRVGADGKDQFNPAGSRSGVVMKQKLKSLADRTVVKAAVYLARKVREAQPRASETLTVLKRCHEMAIEESALYASQKMVEALHFEAAENLWDFAIEQSKEDGLYAEFGVFEGNSINHLARRIGPNITIYGFDSFEGLKEDWKGHYMAKGTFSLGGQLPSVEPNVVLIKGWFDQTVPVFLRDNSKPFSFVHVDCDTYETTAALLSLLEPRLQGGAILLFDEYFGYRGWRLGEWKAWREFVERMGISYNYIGFSNNQVAVRIVPRSNRTET